ncbi:hypothetical protein U1Q18_050778 [Sarracenia purpurea var. burkii]
MGTELRPQVPANPRLLGALDAAAKSRCFDVKKWRRIRASGPHRFRGGVFEMRLNGEAKQEPAFDVQNGSQSRSVIGDPVSITVPFSKDDR